MEPQEYDEILRTLVRIAVHQETINQDQRTLNERLVAAIERIDHTLAGVDITQARIETLLARMIERSDNGKDA